MHRDQFVESITGLHDQSHPAGYNELFQRPWRLQGRRSRRSDDEVGFGTGDRALHATATRLTRSREWIREAAAWSTPSSRRSPLGQVYLAMKSHAKYTRRRCFSLGALIKIQAGRHDLADMANSSFRKREVGLRRRTSRRSTHMPPTRLRQPSMMALYARHVQHVFY